MNEGLVDTQLLSAGPFLHALLLLVVRLGHNGFGKSAQLLHLLACFAFERAGERRELTHGGIDLRSRLSHLIAVRS